MHDEHALNVAQLVGFRAAVESGNWEGVEQMLPQILVWAEAHGHRTLCFQAQGLLADSQRRRSETWMGTESHPWEEGRGLSLLDELLRQLSHAEWLHESEDRHEGLHREVSFASERESDGELVFDMDLEQENTRVVSF
jgi:hypothetical protein